MDFQGLCSAAGKCRLGFGGFRQSSSHPSLFLLLWGGARRSGSESTHGKLLPCGRWAVRFCSVFSGPCGAARALGRPRCALAQGLAASRSSHPRGRGKQRRFLWQGSPWLPFFLFFFFPLKTTRGRAPLPSKPRWSQPPDVAHTPQAAAPWRPPARCPDTAEMSSCSWGSLADAFAPFLPFGGGGLPFPSFPGPHPGPPSCSGSSNEGPEMPLRERQRCALALGGGWVGKLRFRIPEAWLGAISGSD